MVQDAAEHNGGGDYDQDLIHCHPLQDSSPFNPVEVNASLGWPSTNRATTNAQDFLNRDALTSGESQLWNEPSAPTPRPQRPLPRRSRLNTSNLRKSKSEGPPRGNENVSRTDDGARLQEPARHSQLFSACSESRRASTSASASANVNASTLSPADQTARVFLAPRPIAASAPRPSGVPEPFYHHARPTPPVLTPGPTNPQTPACPSAPGDDPVTQTPHSPAQSQAGRFQGWEDRLNAGLTDAEWWASLQEGSVQGHCPDFFDGYPESPWDPAQEETPCNRSVKSLDTALGALKDGPSSPNEVTVNGMGQITDRQDDIDLWCAEHLAMAWKSIEGFKESHGVLAVYEERIDVKEVSLDERAGLCTTEGAELSPENRSVLWSWLNSIRVARAIGAILEVAEANAVDVLAFDLDHPLNASTVASQPVGFTPATQQGWSDADFEAVENTFWTTDEGSLGKIGVPCDLQVGNAVLIASAAAIDAPSVVAEAHPGPALHSPSQDHIDADVNKANFGESWMLCSWLSGNRRCKEAVRADATSIQKHLEARHSADLKPRRDGQVRCKGRPSSSLNDRCTALPSDMGEHLLEEHLSIDAPSRVCQHCWKLAQIKTGTTWCMGCVRSQRKR